MQVGSLVGANIASLRESLMADITGVWFLTRVPALMGLRSKVSLVRRGDEDPREGGGGARSP